jgi:hypothetical protein
VMSRLHAAMVKLTEVWNAQVPSPQSSVPGFGDSRLGTED